MPLLETPYPHVLSSLSSPHSDQPTFLIFYSSIDTLTKRMWCPDCVAVEKPIKEAFESSGAPKGVIHWVGQRSEWRDPNCEARAYWKVNNVPTILRLDQGKENGRLVEGEILQPGRLQRFLNGN